MTTPSLPSQGASQNSWGTQLNTWLRVAHKADGSLASVNGVSGVINVQDPQYGATGNGTTDDTAAIQAAINAATGNAAPATHTRGALAPVYLPRGTYKVTSDLIIQSVQNFKLIGDGPAMTNIRASGTGFTQAVLFVNGSADGVFEGFEVTGDGTEQVIDGIRLDWVTASRTDAGCGTISGSAVVTNTLAQAYDVGATVTGTGIPGGTTVLTSTSGVGWTLSQNCTATGTVTVTVAVVSANVAARSTSGNCFRDIRIRTLKFITGLSLEGNGARQVDGTTLENVIVTGGQAGGSWSSTGNWLVAFAFGCGGNGNNYDHRGLGVDANLCYYGYKINCSSFALLGAQPAQNWCDFYFTDNSAGQTTIKNIQSQNSSQFILGTNSFSPTPVSFEDIAFTTVYPQAGNPLITVIGGQWSFNSISALMYSSGAYQAPIISISGSASTRPCRVNLDLVTLNGPKATCIVPAGASPVSISVRNYANYAPATGVYTAVASGDLESIFTGTGSGGSWTNLDTPGSSIVTPQVNFYTSTATWTKPAGAQTVYVALVADGGGGGSGAFEASGAAVGGSGGGGGGYSTAMFQASQLSGTVAVTLGTGGAGGAAVTGAGAGNPGVAGSGTFFGSYLWAHGGAAGAAGPGASGTAAGGGGGSGLTTGGAGGTGTTGTGGTSDAAVQGATSGGGGGGGVIASGPTAANGGVGYYTFLGSSANTSAGGIVGGASPTSGTAPAFQGGTGPGGGGGAAAITGAAQAGASPQANTGGGGGGGGACSGGTSSGAGAQGAAGYALVITYFQ